MAAQYEKEPTPLETNMETKRGPIKTTVLLKGHYMGFHVSLGECNSLKPSSESSGVCCDFLLSGPMQHPHGLRFGGLGCSV